MEKVETDLSGNCKCEQQELGVIQKTLCIGNAGWVLALTHSVCNFQLFGVNYIQSSLSVNAQSDNGKWNYLWMNLKIEILAQEDCMLRCTHEHGGCPAVHLQSLLCSHLIIMVLCVSRITRDTSITLLAKHLRLAKIWRKNKNPDVMHFGMICTTKLKGWSHMGWFLLK